MNKKLMITFVFVFLLMAAQASAVFMFVNWPDGGTEYRDIQQGNDVAFNYESFEFGKNVDTSVLLINANNPSNPVQTLVERTDYQGDYGYITFSTDSLPAGEYAIFGTATANGATSVAEIDFTLKSAPIPNTAPYFSNIPDYFEYYLSEENDVLFNIAQYANDNEGDLLSFSLDQTNTNTNVVECNLYYQSSLYCDFIGQGITTVDVIVSDGELSTSHTVTIKIIDDTVSNTAPYFTNLPSPFSYPISNGQVTVLQLSDYAFDDENDQLSYSVSGGNGVVSCSVESNANLRCNLLSIGSTDITVTVSDGKLSSTNTITINVYDDVDPNTAPYFQGLPTYFEYHVGQSSADLIDLADYAYDSEDDDLTFSVNEYISGVTCSIVQGSVLRCTFNSVKTGTFTVTVSDGELSDTQTITINIIDDPIENTAPFWSGLPFNYEYDITQDFATLANLPNFAYDNEGDTLSYILDESSTNKNVADCYIDSNNRLKCNFKNNVGSTTVDVIVSDGELSDTQRLTISIVDENPNNPPVWDASLDLYYSYDVDESPVTVFDARNYVSDADGDNIRFSLDESSTNFDVMNCFLSNGHTLVCLLDDVGTTTVDVIASDGEFDIPVTVTINVYDQVENHPPYWFANIPDYFEYDIAQGNVDVLQLSNYAGDVDGDSLYFFLDQANTDFDVIDCKLRSGSTLNCDLNGVGTTTLRVLVSDGEVSVSQLITIKVMQEDLNEKPFWKSNMPLYFEYNVDLGNVEVINLAQYAVDPDGDSLSYSLDESSTNQNIVDCSLSGSTLNCNLEGVGQTTLKVKATDGEYTISKTITIKVFEINRPPVWSNSLDLYYSYHIDESPVTVVNLKDYVSDPDGDSITLRLDESSTDFDVMNCFLSNNRNLVCILEGVGTTTVDAIASDGESETDVTITINVYDDPNEKPYWKSNMPHYFEYNIDEENVEVLNLAMYAVDSDGDSLTFSLDQSSTNNNIVDCSLSGTRLKCDLNGIGTTTLDVVVSDGEYSVAKTITIHVYENNYPPKWKTYLPDYFEYDIDDANVDVLNLADFVSDPDGDTLTFSLDQSSTEIVDCDIRSSSIMNCDLNSVGRTSVTVIVSDGEFDVRERITIKVYQDNEPPFFVNLPTYFEYDIDLENVQVFNIENYVEDPDDDALTYSLDTTQTDASIIDCNLQYTGSLLVCNLNGVGTSTVDILVSDGEFTIRKTITIKVFQDNYEHEWAANLPTQFSYPLSQQVVTLFKVSDYVINPDNNELNYVLNEVNTNFQVVDCFLEADTDIVCVLNGVGTTQVDVRVYDFVHTIVETLSITVYDDNHPPYFGNNMQKYFEYDIDLGNVDVVNLAQFAFDPDGDSLTYTIDDSQTNNNIVSCDLLGSTLNCDLNGLGQTTLNVIVSDGRLSQTATITIKVIQDNTPPYFTTNNLNFEYNIDETNVDVVQLLSIVTDEQGDVLTFTLDQSNTNSNVVDCVINSQDVLNCDLNGVGSTTLEVDVNDGEYTDSATITITVFKLNQPPQFDANIPTYFSYPLSMGDATLMDISDYVIDIDGDLLYYSLDDSNTNTNVVECSLTFQSQIDCDLRGVGTTNFDVVVSDGEYEIRKTVTVNVYNDNVPPYFQANMPTYFEYPLSLGAVNLFKVVDYVYDDNNDQLSISIDTTQTNSAIVSCSLSQDTSIACDINGVGTTTVDVVVSDGEFTIRQTVTIKIIDDTPVGPTAIIVADGNRNVVGTPFNFNGYSSYTIPNEYIVSYDWVVRNPNGDTIAIFNGPAQSYTFTDQNEYTIELAVTDSQGLVDSTFYTLQSRWGKAPKKDFGPEDGIFINSLEIHGTDFEEAQVEGEFLVYATIENTGDEDLKNVRMVFTIPELGYKVKSNAIDLREGERETLQIRDFLPDYVYEGHYYPVVSFSDSEVRRSKPLYLEVTE